MPKVSLKTNVVYDHCQYVHDQFHEHKGRIRFLVEQGGTRSGKTYNILIWIICGYLLRYTGKIVTIVRKTGPALSGTSRRDFFEILNSMGLYSEAYHNKSENIYYLNGNMVEFLSVDQQQKIRGRKRDLLYCNEVNELKWEDFFQLMIRTSEQIIMDYNPSDFFHWVYEKILKREDALLEVTTFRDNPFLPETMVQEIELLESTDENLWKIYGLGQRGENKSQIFTLAGEVETIPEDAKLITHGLDFGFKANPSALIGVYHWPKENGLIMDEEFYEYGMTNQDIVAKLTELGIKTEIRADSEDSKACDEIRRAKFKVKDALKGRDSVRFGIDKMRRYKLYITGRSDNLRREFRAYKYKEDRDGNVTNEPIKAFDHGIDATRYAIELFGRSKKTKSTTY